MSTHAYERLDRSHSGYRFRAEWRTTTRQSAEKVFARLDDPARLARHMSRRSWRMGWGRMTVETDALGGTAVGSRISLKGRVFGIRLSLSEVVIERNAPFEKCWETIGEPRLLVIGRYRMGFRLLSSGETRDARSEASSPASAREVLVYIDYDLPSRGLARFLGRIAGHGYARWCVRRIAQEVDAPAALELRQPWLAEMGGLHRR